MLERNGFECESNVECEGYHAINTRENHKRGTVAVAAATAMMLDKVEHTASTSNQLKTLL